MDAIRSVVMAGKPPFSTKDLAILKVLCHLNREQRKALLAKADTSLVKSLCECALNILSGNVALKTSEKARLKKHVKFLRRLANEKGSWSGKRKVIVQHGAGIIPYIIAPILDIALRSILK